MVHKTWQLVFSNRFEPVLLSLLSLQGQVLMYSSNSENVHVDLNRVRENVLVGN